MAETKDPNTTADLNWINIPMERGKKSCHQSSQLSNIASYC